MTSRPIALQRQDASGTVAYLQQVAAASNGANRMPIETQAKHHAFCVDDVQFLGIGQFCLTTPRAISHREEVYYVELTFRMQKNGKHGEVKRYSRNIRTPSLDAIANWIVILEHFDRLVRIDNKQRPLAIYYDYDKKKTMNICSNDSKCLMQNTVRLEFGITDIKELSKSV
jgi:hypothetical protein